MSDLVTPKQVDIQYETDTPILYEVVDNVAWITMDRPGFNNAQNGQMTYALDDCFNRAVQDDSVGAIVLAMDVKGPLVGFELILNAIPASKSKGATRPPLVISDLMPLSRDFAFVVDDAVVADKLVKAAKGADKALIADVAVFDLYKLEGGKKSLAIEVTLQPKDKTLTEAEIEEAVAVDSDSADTVGKDES